MTDKNKNDKGSVYYLLPNIFKCVIIMSMKSWFSLLITVAGVLILLSAGSALISWGDQNIRLPKLESVQK